MSISSLFRSGGKYFNKNIEPKCDYCQFGKRAKDGNKVLCEKKGSLVDTNFSCGKFSYSPLKRIPVKQLKFVGSLADDEIYIETADDKAEKDGENNVASADTKKGTPKVEPIPAAKTEEKNESEEKAESISTESEKTDSVSEENA